MRIIVRQAWQNLTFLHWRYNADVIRRLLPSQLTLDTFDGDAWIGLVPFLLSGIRPSGFPSTPWLSQFPETNVRTYVLGPDGKPGVWFFTLDADRLIAVLAARIWYKLPYRWADMKVTVGEKVVEYQSRRSRLFGQGSTDLAIEIGDPVETSALDYFLTARFRLYTGNANRFGYAEVEHNPWPLQRATVLRLNEDLILNSGVPAPTGEPLVHYSRDLQVGVAKLQWYK